MTLIHGTNIEVVSLKMRDMKVGMVMVGALWCAAAVAADGIAGLVDPTRPAGASAYAEPVVETAVPAGPVLQSTMVAPTVKRAIISGKTYTIGARIGNAVVTDIHPYEVVLNQDGRETRLRLVPPLAKDASGRSAERVKGVSP